MASLKQARRLLKQRKGQAMSEMIIAVVIIVLVLVIGVMIYLRSSGALSAIGTATGSASLASDGSLLLTVGAQGGKITIAGIVLDSPTGVVATVGTTPGYTAPSSPTCSLSAVYIAGAAGSTTPPWVVQNGKAASFTFKPSSTGGCSSVTSIIVFYNSGKVLQISVG
jgi:hypothetical protein